MTSRRTLSRKARALLERFGLSYDHVLGFRYAVNVFIATTIVWSTLKLIGDSNPIWAIASMVAASDPVPEEARRLFRSRRIKGWRRAIWPCPWIGKGSELLEPFFFLPMLLVTAWLFVLLRQWLALDAGGLAILCAILAVVLMAVFCVMWVWWQQKDEK